MIERIENPFSQILLEKKPQLFHGREQILASIVQGICAPEPRSFTIDGMKTFGKTTLLRFLNDPQGARQKYPETLNVKDSRGNAKILFLYIDLYRLEGNEVLRALYQNAAADPEIAERIEDRTLLEAQPQTGREAQAHVKALFDALQECGARLVMLLDNLDTAFQTMDLETDLFLRGLTQGHVYVLATEKSLNLLRSDAARSSPLYNILLTRRLGPLAEDEARRMVEHPLNGPQTVPFSNDEIEFILEACGMQPFLIATVGEFFYDLHLQYPKVKNFMETPDFRSHVGYQLLEHPAVAELFSLFWHDLDATEQYALSALAGGQKGTIEPQVITRLWQKGFLKIDVPTGRKWIYSSLFKLYIQQQAHPVVESLDMERMVNTLSAIDRKLYSYMAANPNRLLSFEELLGNIWGNPKATRKGLEAAVHRLRLKIKQVRGYSQDNIQNVRGKGFIYHSDPE